MGDWRYVRQEKKSPIRPSPGPSVLTFQGKPLGIAAQMWRTIDNNVTKTAHFSAAAPSVPQDEVEREAVAEEVARAGDGQLERAADLGRFADLVAGADGPRQKPLPLRLAAEVDEVAAFRADRQRIAVRGVDEPVQFGQRVEPVAVSPVEIEVGGQVVVVAPLAIDADRVAGAEHRVDAADPQSGKKFSA